MKRITRITHAGSRKGEQVWLNQFGSWTHDEGQAYVFDDVDAEKRLKRLPHAKAENVPTQEKDDV